jgi:hypothetical protein
MLHEWQIREMHVEFWYESQKERDALTRPDVGWWIILKWIWERQHGVVWTGLVRIRIGTSRRLLWTQQWTYGFPGRAITQAVSRRLPSWPPNWSPGQVMWDLWWTKQHWGRFSLSISVSPTKHSTDCSTLIIHHPGLVHQASNGLSNSGLSSTPPQKGEKRGRGSIKCMEILCTLLPWVMWWCVARQITNIL